MTADWRATLERVERLAGWTRRDRREPDKVMAYASEAGALLRGLLAEPQPGEAERLRAAIRDHREHVEPTAEIIAADRVLWAALAEPQVNPSEAKDEALKLAQTALHKLCLARGSTDGYGHVFEAINAALPSGRAGLLAEGEESREP